MSTNPDTVRAKVLAWIPLGTPEEQAKRIMADHGFECRTENRSAIHPSHGPAIVCSRENRFYNRLWIVTLFLQDGTVVGADQPSIMGGILKPPSGAHF